MIKRAFVYGDLLFESMLILNNEIQYAPKHFERLIKSAAILKMELSSNFTFDFFKNEILNAFQNSALKNKDNCRVRFVLYRDSAGFYLPDFNTTNFIIEVFELPLDWEKKNNTIKKAGLFTIQKKAIGPYSNLKTGNALLYVMAKLWAKENDLDEAIILNQNEHIIETASANIYWKKNGITYTVPLSDGCVAGVSREVFLEQMAANQLLVNEKTCTLLDLQNADEIFMSNVASGICKIVLV